MISCVEPLGGLLVSETEGGYPLDAMELLYLISEFFVARGNYSRVKNIRETYSTIWKLYKEDPTGLEMCARRVKLCIARAMELTGDLQEAHDLYKSCGDSRHERLEACLDGKQVYLYEKLNVRIQNLSDGSSRLNARQLPNGKIARTTSPSCPLIFLTRSPILSLSPSFLTKA